MKYRLFDISGEPGFAMNADLEGTDTDNKNVRDFTFKTQSGWSLLYATENDDAKSMKSKNFKSTHKGDVTSRDYGSFGKMEAYLTEIDGHGNLPDTKGRRESADTPFIKLPVDDNNNHIADSWRNNDKANTRDLDAKPEPDVSEFKEKGDSISRYQEYRGFITTTGHTRTDPSEKDFFVWNSDRFDTKYLTSQNVDTSVHYVSEDYVGAIGKAAQKYRQINFNDSTAEVGRQSASRIEENTYFSDGESCSCLGQVFSDSEEVGTSYSPHVPNNFDTGYVYTKFIREEIGTYLSEDISASDTVISVGPGIDSYRNSGIYNLNVDGGGHQNWG